MSRLEGSSSMPFHTGFFLLVVAFMEIPFVSFLWLASFLTYFGPWKILDGKDELQFVCTVIFKSMFLSMFLFCDLP